MAESDSNTPQEETKEPATSGGDGYELTRIKALASSIGAILTDGAGVDPEDVGMLAFMICEIVDRMEKRIYGIMPRSRPTEALEKPERAEKEAA